MASGETSSVAEGGVADEDDYNDSEEDTELQKAKQALTGRGVTLSDLMDDDIIQAGANTLSIDYRGQRFEADLLPTGKIKWQGAEEEFGTPSAWATHCKRLVNPIKRSGCGWASVKYKGRKLDTWKSVWSRRHHPGSPFRSTSPHQAALAVESHNGTSLRAMQLARQENGKPKTEVTATTEAAQTSLVETITSTTASSLTGTAEVSATAASATSPVSNGAGNSASSRPYSDSYVQPQAIQEEALNLSASGPNAGSNHPDENGKAQSEHLTPCGLAASGQRLSVAYASLGPRSDARDPCTFVKCEHFATLGRTQPFNVTVSTNALMLMDFHCHLSTSEVVGYLGGSWCPQTQNVRISQAFPCRCLLTDKDKASIVEDEIRQSIEKQGCSVVGWYHSHPLCQPDPTLRDIDCQMQYQLSMKGPGGIYLPCVGLILAPFDRRNSKAESSYEAFWVMPPPEDTPGGYGMPMHVKCSVHQSSSLSEELLNEMNQLADFYRGGANKVRWKELWSDKLSYVDKLKSSLRSKLPKDQMESGSFFAYLQQLVTRK
ncbi:MPN domain-containing protein-like [Littorina saxatilis]|uniref:MPN domain-containing protein n=1 Tax=Littorina saxatilis TaxID=31220 RepID=A0AAN9BTL5_9CAEN